MSDLNALIQAMQQDPSLAGGAAPQMAAPPMSDPSLALGQGGAMDPAMLTSPAPGMPGAGMPGAGGFASVDPMMIAQAVQQTLAGMAAQDAHMLEMQQMQAGAAAQPIIDQMLTQAMMPPMEPDADNAMPMGADPAMAFGEGTMPPLPPEGMVR